MRVFIFALCALTLPLLALEPAAPAPPVAQPPVIVVQAPQSTTEKITMWGIIATLAITTLSGLVGFALKKVIELKPLVDELRGRQDRQAMKTGSLQAQVNAVALQTPAAAPPAVAPPAEQRPPGSVIGAAVALCLVPCFLWGCAADPASKAGQSAAAKQALVEAGKVLGQVAVSSLLNVAQQEIGGGKADFGQAAAAGLWGNVNAATTSGAIGNIVTAYSAGKATQTAQAASSAARGALAQGKSPPAVVAAVATVISTAAGAPPAR